MTLVDVDAGQTVGERFVRAEPPGTSDRQRETEPRHGYGGQPLSEPIYQTSAFAFADSAQTDAHVAAGGAVYARDGLPNVRSLERIVARLEGAEDALAVASGMAAIAITITTMLAAGERVVIPSTCYRDTTALLDEHFARFSVASTRVDMDNPRALREAITPNTRLVFVETISNPGIKLADLPVIAGIVGETGALLCIDNTFASPALCRPLAYGADLVIHSAGKFLGGHHDLTAGVVAGRRELIDRLRSAAYLFGPTLAPMEAWLTVRGIGTLGPRMAWVSQTAASVARFLQSHPAVAAVRYPGLATGCDRGLVQRLLPDGAGGVLAFDLAGGADAADRFVGALRTIPYAATVGGVISIVSYPPQREMAGRTTRYRSATVRFSAGMEDRAEIVADLRQALDRLMDGTGGWDAASLETNA